MRRPIVACCLAQAAGILLVYCDRIDIHHLCLLGAGVVFFVRKSEGSCRMAHVVLCFFLAGACSMYLHRGIADPLAAREGEVLHLSGVVRQVSVKPYRIDAVVAIDRGGRPQRTLESMRTKTIVQLPVNEGDASVDAYDFVGRRIYVDGKIALPEARRNPGGFDYRLHLLGKGVRTLCRTSKYRVDLGGIERELLHFLSVKKGAFLRRTQEILTPASRAVLSGLLFGETGELPEELYEAFQHSGISHIFAVSGLHVGLLFGLIAKGSKRWRRSVAWPVTLALMAVYAALANFSMSVLRASGMVCLSMIAPLLKKRYDLLGAASFMASVLLLGNPYRLFGTGFQLSFLAAYTVGVALPYVEWKVQALADRWRDHRIVSAGGGLAACAAIQSSMAPLVAYQFFLFAPAGLFVNPPALAIAGLLLPVGLCMLVVSALEPLLLLIGAFGLHASNGLLAALSGIVEALCTILIRCSALGTFPFRHELCPAPPIGLVAAFYGVFFFYFSEARFILLRKHRREAARCAMIAVAALCAMSPFLLGISRTPLPWRYDTADVTFLDVGQGDCIHIREANVNILVDGGGHFYTDIGKSVLEPYFLRHGIKKIDVAFCTHADLDHMKGIAELSQLMEVGVLAIPEAYRAGPEIFSGIQRKETMYLARGHIVEVGDSLAFSILWPDGSLDAKASDNDKSLVMMLSYGGVRMLLCGDADHSIESRLQEPLTCDVLKVGHHGSDGSTGREFVAAADPAIAVISCGRDNSYGHPSPRVVELLTNSGIITGRTDSMGALSLRLVSDDRYVVENARREERWVLKRKDIP